MKYQTIEGKLFDLDTFTKEEKQLFDDLYAYAQHIGHWTSLMQPHIYHGDIVNRAKKSLGTKWQDYSLYKINMDLIARTGVRLGNFKQPEAPYPDPIID